MTASNELFSKIRPYLPNLLIDKIREEGFAPSIEILEGSLMFADISGFTAISERLASVGKSGAEELTEIINHHLSGIVSIIISFGGDILKFGGDAALVYFKDTTSAVGAAFSVNNWATAHKEVKASAGKFNLSLHTGLHYGKFFSAEVGDYLEKLEHIVTGDALNQVFNAADYAEGGQVGATTDFVKASGDNIRSITSEGNFHLILPDMEIEIPPYRKSAEIYNNSSDLNLLSKFLPQGLFGKLSTGRNDSISAEHRRITVMFINYSIEDNINFMGRADELKVRLDDYFRMVNEAISSLGGVITRVDCYSKGDKILAVFGAMRAHQDDDLRAVKSAIRMQNGLEKLRNKTGWKIKQRIGINSGKAFCGEVGGLERREYTVMGDDVNLAARLMSKADDYDILIGEKTSNGIVNSTISTESAGKVTVKGKSMPIPVYRVTQEESDDNDFALEALSAHSGPIIGRKNEQQLLKEKILSAKEGNFCPIIIEGEAGIGKSRLTARFLELTLESELPGFAGVCQAYGNSIPFQPFKPIFEKLLDIRDGNSERGRIIKFIDELGFNGFEPLLNDILELNLTETPITNRLDAKTRLHRLFDLLYAIFRNESEKSPFHIILEDIHWIDETSFEFLNYIFEQEPINGFLVLGVTRPEERISKSIIYKMSTIIHLKALPPEEATELISSLLKIKQIPPRVKELVINRSQGNPFFTGEIVRSLKDSGYITKDENTGEMIFAGDIESIELPDNINSLVLSRIDRLDETAKDVIKTASIIGRSFSLDILQDIFPYKIEKQTLIENLGKLSSLDLTPIDRKGENPSYIFKHILTQEVAYNFQSFREREILHERVGFNLENKYKNNLHPHLEVLAHHFSNSRCKAKAFYYLIKAGEKAFSIYANFEAMKYLREAENIYNKPGRYPAFVKGDDIIFILKTKGSINRRMGAYDKAIDDYKKLYRYLKRWKDYDFVSKILTNISEAKWLKGDYDGAARSAKKGLKIASEHKNEYGRAVNLFALGEISRLRGDFKNAIELFNQAIKIFKSFNKSSDLSNCLNSLGISFWSMGELEKALPIYKEALQIHKKLSDLEGEAKVLNNLGLIYLDTGKPEKALGNFKKAASIFERIGDNRNKSYCLGNIGYIQKNYANIGEAESAFKEALKQLKKIGDIAGSAYTYSNLGDLYLQNYNPKQALRNHKMALEIAESLKDDELISELLGGIALDNVALGRFAEAEESAQKAYEISKRIGAKIFTIRSLYALVEADISDKNREIDINIRELEELVRSDKSEYGIFGLYSLAKFYQSRQDYQKAKSYFETVLDKAVKTNLRQLEWKVRYKLGELILASANDDYSHSIAINHFKTASKLIYEAALSFKTREEKERYLSIPEVKKILKLAGDIPQLANY